MQTDTDRFSLLISTSDPNRNPHSYGLQSKKQKIAVSVFAMLLLIVIVSIVLVVVIETGDSGGKRKPDDDPTDWKSKFMDIPSTVTLRQNSEYLTAYAHEAATPHNYIYAEYIHNQFIEFGFHSELLNSSDDGNDETVFITRFINASLAIIDNADADLVLNELHLSEEIIAEDATSDCVDRHQPFLAYVANKSVTGVLIYANYGSREDYQALLDLGYNLTELISIVKYGGNMHRGNKVYLAQKFGMKGVIIYSDPLDYAPEKYEIYPNGLSLPPSGFQRGSAGATFICPGNILSAERVQRMCNLDYADVVPQIPAIPLSYGNAYQLMSQMHGDSVAVMDNSSSGGSGDNEWQGGMNFSYNLGGYLVGAAPEDEVTVRLSVENENEASTITNVIAYYKGSVYPNEAVLVGNHRDAWAFGASDPISGSIVTVEIARAFGAIIEQGWRPLRTIMIGSWDAEERGLVGSTYYGETNADVIQGELVAYLNVDGAVSGHEINIKGDPMLAPFIIDQLAQHTMPDAEDGTTLYDHWMARQTSADATQLTPFGYGSDYTVFVHRLGIPAIDTGFGGSQMRNVYHSIYDSFSWMDNLMDPEWTYHQTMAQYLGGLVFDLVDSALLPFNVSNVGVSLHKWVTEDIQELIVEFEFESNATDALILDMQESINVFASVAKLLEYEMEGLVTDVTANDFNADAVEQYNQILCKLYQEMLYEPGLPTRPWFRNLLYGPDLESGYAPQVFPYIAYALKYNHSMAAEAFEITSDVIRFGAHYLNTYTTHKS